MKLIWTESGYKKKMWPFLNESPDCYFDIFEIMTIFTYEDINDYKSLINKFSSYLFEILIISIILS